ncbi:twin-arginine translocase TatA/TatE family subunit [Armatimonas sp.]|uniref:Sec-independent protein translocase subunit TatA/TatB n=1 Tax=Armatimonas sp. TaxID=1872638 RepID=UPI00286AE945|nr:twin-arginine translocase TatA/TatE family subunit [Armatimonas sp.]
MYTFAYLGMPQIVIILVIALLIFGPQKVPDLARQIGGALRDLKKMSSDVQSAFDLDDHSSYDRYEPPTYEYTSPVSTTYDHEPLDQYGLPAVAEHPALEAVATEQPIEALHPTETLVDAVATEHLAEAVAVVPPLELETVTTTEETTVLETETTEEALGADTAAKSA